MQQGFRKIKEKFCTGHILIISRRFIDPSFPLSPGGRDPPGGRFDVKSQGGE